MFPGVTLHPKSLEADSYRSRRTLSDNIASNASYCSARRRMRNLICVHVIKTGRTGRTRRDHLWLSWYRYGLNFSAKHEPKIPNGSTIWRIPEYVIFKFSFIGDYTTTLNWDKILNIREIDNPKYYLKNEMSGLHLSQVCCGRRGRGRPPTSRDEPSPEREQACGTITAELNFSWCIAAPHM